MTEIKRKTEVCAEGFFRALEHMRTGRDDFLQLMKSVKLTPVEPSNRGAPPKP